MNEINQINNEPVRKSRILLVDDEPGLRTAVKTFLEDEGFEIFIAVDGDGFRNHLLRNFGIEIGNGLGELSGKVWRIGLMGFNSSEENVDRLLNLFDTELKKYSIFETSTF